MTVQANHPQRSSSQRGVGLVEVILALTMGSVVLVTVAGTWGSYGLWTRSIGDRAVVLREARAAREYIERDLLDGEVLDSSTTDRLHILPGAGGGAATVEYRLVDGRLVRSLLGRAESIPVATHLEAIEFAHDPDLERASATLLLRANGSRLRLTVKSMPAAGLAGGGW